MNLINQVVTHKTFGDGKVINIDSGYIIILFQDRERKFVFPSAFRQHLLMKDPACASFVQEELLRLDEKEVNAAEQKRVLQLQQYEASLAATPAKKEKELPRANIAFKCNYCDGGKSTEQVGFNGICSDKVIYNNIMIEKRTWCSDESCPCLHHLQGKLDRKQLEQQYKVIHSDLVCYESRMLRDWRALAGIVLSGDRKGEHKSLHKLKMNSLCILTTRDPGSSEESRCIFAVFIVDETYEGNTREEGYVSTQSKYRLKLSPDEAHKMLFWNYHANDNRSEVALWSSGLHRYINDDEAVQILRDVVSLKMGTADELLAKEFLSHFVMINGIDAQSIPDKYGALIRATSKNIKSPLG